jgi:hypothetical protein
MSRLFVPDMFPQRAGATAAFLISPDLGTGKGDMPPVQQSRDFGGGDRPPCSECGGEMFLTHRGPHPDYGVDYEAQTFTCSTCLYKLERTVNRAGELHI